MSSRAAGTFRVNTDFGNLGNNAFDLGQQQFSLFAGWSKGNTILDNLVIPTRDIASNWLVTSVSVTAILTLILQPQAGYGTFGKLSPIMAGLTAQGPQTLDTTVSPQLPNVNYSLSPLPGDDTLIGVLFDPTSDALPPSMLTNAAVLTGKPVSMSITPPNPIQVPAGSNLYIGIWLPPALLSAAGSFGSTVGLGVSRGQYLIEYDDANTGQGPTLPMTTTPQT